jgi:hypothetical protein
MGCKCANSNDEEGEIERKEPTDRNINQAEPKNGYSSPYDNDGNNNNKIIVKNNDNINYSYNHMNSEERKSLDIIQHNNDDSKTQRSKEDSNIKYSDYSLKIVELINTIRQDPSSYADYIEDSIKNIIENNNKNDNSKIKIIYKQKVKVALAQGEPAFRDAAEQLRNMEPIPPLEFSPSMCIPLPESDEEMKDSTFLRSKVKELREEGIDIDVFFKDLVKIPEVSALLMIVDDSNKNVGKKRLALLNKDFKYIGVNSKFIGKTFIAYLAFSK